MRTVAQESCYIVLTYAHGSCVAHILHRARDAAAVIAETVISSTNVDTCRKAQLLKSA